MASESNAVDLPKVMAEPSWNHSGRELISSSVFSVDRVKSAGPSVDRDNVVVSIEATANASSVVLASESSKCSYTGSIANECERLALRVDNEEGEAASSTDVCRTSMLNCIDLDSKAHVNEIQCNVTISADDCLCKSVPPSSPVANTLSVCQQLETSVTDDTPIEVKGEVNGEEDKELCDANTAVPLEVHTATDNSQHTPDTVRMTTISLCESSCEKQDDVDMHCGEQFQAADSNVADCVLSPHEVTTHATSILQPEDDVVNEPLHCDDATGIVSDTLQHDDASNTLQQENADKSQGNEIDVVQCSEPDYIQRDDVENAESDNINYVQHKDTDSVQHKDTDNAQRIDTDIVQNFDTDSMQHVNTDNVQHVDSYSGQCIDTDNVQHVNTDSVQCIDADSMQHVNTDSVQCIDTDNFRQESAASIQHKDSSEDTMHAGSTTEVETDSLQHDNVCSVTNNTLRHEEAAIVTNNQHSTIVLEQCDSCVDASSGDHADENSGVAVDESEKSVSMTDVHSESAASLQTNAGVILVDNTNCLTDTKNEIVDESTAECLSVAETTAASSEDATTAKDIHNNALAANPCSSEQISKDANSVSSLIASASENIATVADYTAALATSIGDVCEIANEATYQCKEQENIEQGKQLNSVELSNVVACDVDSQMKGVTEQVERPLLSGDVVEGTIDRLKSLDEASVRMESVCEQPLLGRQEPAVDPEPMESDEVLDYSTGGTATSSAASYVDNKLYVADDPVSDIQPTGSDEAQLSAHSIECGEGASNLNRGSEASHNTDLHSIEESSTASSKMATAMSNLDLILQSVAHPSSPYADSSAKSDVLLSDTPTPSSINLLANFTSAAAMAFSVTPVKRKRGRPKLVRDPVIGPDGIPIEQPKGKYVRKKPRNSVGAVGESNSALDLTMASKVSLQENLVPIPPKRKYTKKVKVAPLDKSREPFDGFVMSQTGCSTPTASSLGGHMWPQRLPSISSTKLSTDTDNESINDNLHTTKGDTSLNESFESTGSNDLSDDQRLTSGDGDLLNGSCNSSNSPMVASAFENLRETILLHGERFYRCPVCAYMAKQKGNLRRHLQQHNIFQCSHCPFCTIDNPRLDNHMKEAHPSRWGRRKCTKCSKFVRVEDQEEHLASCTGELMDWPCEQCPKVFHYEGALKVHMKMHREQQPAKLICGCCGKQYKYEAAMRSHLLTHGAENLVGVCTRCGTKCASDAELQEHLKAHLLAKNNFPDHNRMSVDSSEEKKETFDDSELAEDEEESELKIDAPAVDCSAKSSLPGLDGVRKLPNASLDGIGTASASTETSLLAPDSARSATGDKTRTIFSCGQCSYETKFKSNLAKHISELHSEKGEKTVKCPLCDKLFNTECGMQKHLKILHSEERSFICQVCNKAFKTPNSLTLHSEVHNSDETYACNIDGCSKTFRAKRMLTNHKKLEHGILVKRFDCRQPGCGQVFVKESHLRKHLAGAHAGEKIVEEALVRRKSTGLKMEVNSVQQKQHAGDNRCSGCHLVFGDSAQLAAHVHGCTVVRHLADDEHDDEADSDSNDTIIDERFTDSKSVKEEAGLRAVYNFVEHVEGGMGGIKVRDTAGGISAPVPAAKAADGIIQPKKRGRKPKDKSLMTPLPAAGDDQLATGDGAVKKRGRKKKVLEEQPAKASGSGWVKTEPVPVAMVSAERDRLLSAEGLMVDRSSTDSQSTLNRQHSTDTQSILNQHDHPPGAGRSSSISSHDDDDDNGSESEFGDIHDPDGRSAMTGNDLLNNLHSLPQPQQQQLPPPPAPSIFDDGLPLQPNASDNFRQEGSEFGVNAVSSVKGEGTPAYVEAGLVNRNFMLSPDKTSRRESTNLFPSERYVGDMEREGYMPPTPSMGSHQHSPLVGQQQRASSVISHTSQQAVSSDAYGAAYAGPMIGEGQSPLSTSAATMYSVNSPATYSSPAFFSAAGGFGAPNAMSSMLSSYSSGSGHYGTSSSAPRADEPARPADSLFQPGGLGFGSALPPSSTYGSEGLANRDIFNPYFSDPALSLGLNHSSLSVQDQRALSYMQSLQQRGERSAGSTSSYPMPTSDAFSTITPPSLQQQHWMSGAAERSRPWGRSSPTLVNPIATSGAAYPEYGFDASKRPGESGFAPPSSTPGGLASGSAYGLPSSYMSAAGRSSLGQAADVSSYGRQKTFEDAYQQMANSYRSLSQGSSSVSDVYGRIGMAPFDKYYYPSDPLYRSQQLAASAASSNSMFLSQSPMYAERDYLRNPVPGYPSAAASNSYGLGSKLSAGVGSTDYLQGRPAGSVDPALQDPYQRSVLYNMMSRYYQ